MNSATPKLMGTAITMAMVAVKTVPQMKGSAPNKSSGGDQRLVVKNPNPISWNTGSERRVMVMRDEPQDQQHERRPRRP